MSFFKNKNSLFELIRYCIVGAVAAVIDLLVLSLLIEYIFAGEKTGWPLTISTAAGFMSGLICNYVLSMLFVFVSKEQKEANQKRVKTFVLFGMVGIIGLILTEILMHLGMTFVSKEGFWYVLLSCVVKGIVMIWNYVGRKIFVYKGN